jgi:hypothetical protein
MFMTSYPDHSRSREPGKAQQVTKKGVKVIAYLLASFFVFLYKGVAYSLAAGQYCSGTGTGETRFYRLCNDLSFFIPLGLDLLLPALLMFWHPIRRLHLRYRLLLLSLCAIYIFFSPFIWDLPFFLTPVYPD